MSPMEENLTILIVDDEPETLKGYADFLSAKESSARRSSRRTAATEERSVFSPNETYRLLTASTGERAVEIAFEEGQAGRRIAAGFFDVKLGEGMDGIATIQKIRELDPGIHCVIVTAYQDRSVEEIHKLFGDSYKDCWDYLNKPFTQGEIVQKARQMTGAWNKRERIAHLNQQLVKSERLAAIGQVARGVGHEFGNILLRIMGKTDLALMAKEVGPIHEHLKVAMMACERAAVIVRNLQTFSRPEQSFQLRKLSDSLDESLSLVQHEMVKNSITHEKTYTSTRRVRVDMVGIGQVFLNLLINAVQAMPRGGKITVGTQDEAWTDGRDGVGAWVFDSGTGISEEILPRIFDYAFSTKGDQGSGLGLAISKEIVEAHGGKITVKTLSGKGTEFRVWIPVVKGST